MTRFAWLAPCLLLFPAPTFAAETTSVEQIIQQLGSKNPKMREKGRKALEHLGPEALPTLRKALNHPDLEVRKRIAEIVPAIETAELVKPKLITLKAQKKTAGQLLAELSQQTGYKLETWNDDPRQLYTLDLERVPFWKAVDEIGRLTGLSPMVGYGDDRLRFQKENGFPGHISYQGAFRFVPVNFEYHRTLSFRRVGDDGRPPVRAETLTLQYLLFAEPKLPILSIGEALVQEAIDSEGRPLQEPAHAPTDGPGGPVIRRTARYGNGYASTAVQGSLSLGRPSEKARGLKLLRVALPVNLLVEQKSEVVCDKVLEVKKKKIKVGTTTFDIESCVKSSDRNTYVLKMTATEENLAADDYTWMNSLYRRVELVDEKGNNYVNHGSSWSHSAPNHVQVTFNYGPSGGAELGPPRKLMYQVWKTLPYQIQAEVRDLPLP